jgi:hypothetical protein
MCRPTRVVANPPFSYRWEPGQAMSEDPRFKNYGVGAQEHSRLPDPAAGDPPAAPITASAARRTFCGSAGQAASSRDDSTS